MKKIKNEKYWYIISDEPVKIQKYNHYYIQKGIMIYLRYVIEDFNTDKLYIMEDKDCYPIDKDRLHLYKIYNTNNPHLKKIKRKNKLLKILK